MRSERKHQAWNFWSVFVFLSAVVLVGYLLRNKGVDLEEMTFKQALLIILASYRMTRIIVFEKIFKHFRDALKNRENLYVIGSMQP